MWKTILKVEQIVGQRQSLFLPEHLEVEDRDDCLDKIEEIIGEVNSKTRILPIPGGVLNTGKGVLINRELPNDVACWVLEELEKEKRYFDEIITEYVQAHADRVGEDIDYNPTNRKKVFNGVEWTFIYTVVLNDTLIMKKVMLSSWLSQTYNELLIVEDLRVLSDELTMPLVNQIMVDISSTNEDEIIRYIKNGIDWG